MGGSAGAVIKKSVDRTVKSVGNIGEGVLAGDVSKVVKNTGYVTEEFIKGYTGLTFVKAGLGAVADATGATAAQKGLENQIEMSKQETRRQALLSDALAREQGADSAQVSLNTGKNRRNAGSSATGISGTSSSNGTGVQS